MVHQYPLPPDCSGFIYTVVSGDTLYILSNRFGVPLSDIIAANPQLDNPNLIYPGQKICIPLPPAPETCSGFFYTIQSGDTLGEISQRYGIRLVDIAIANPQIVNPDVIFAGQIICIPLPSPPEVCAGFLYTVEPGDTLQEIANDFGVTLQQIFAANPQIIDVNKIYAGQQICIPNGS